MTSANMSLTAFWFAQGKSHARDGKPPDFRLNERQLLRYTAGERDAAGKAYADGYAFGLPEEWNLMVTPDGNCLEFRLNGVLLERVHTIDARAGMAYIPVLRAIRRFHPSLHDFQTAKKVWEQAQRTGLVYTPQQAQRTGLVYTPRVGRQSIDERETA